MILESGIVSKPLEDVINEKKWSPTDTISFFDDSADQKFLGASFVDLAYFNNNPYPNGKLQENMCIKKVNRDDFYQSMINTAAKLAIKHYKFSKKESYEIIAFVMCNMLKKNHVEATISNMGYNLDKMPPIINVLGERLVRRGKLISMRPRDYWYKQQVGNYAGMLGARRGK